MCERGSRSIVCDAGYSWRKRVPHNAQGGALCHCAQCTKLAIVKYSIALATLACAAACAAVLPPYELECEARRNPVGVDAPPPRLSWQLRAEQQSAYQIQVGTSPDAAGLW